MNSLFSKLFFIALTCWFIIAGNHVYAQNYADKEFFLIEKLEYDKIGESDKILLDSCLSIFHKSKSDTTKTNAIKHIVEQSWDENIWPKYNDWLYNFVKNKLNQKIPKKVKDNLRHVYASTINNKGYYHSTKGEPLKALDYYKESLKIQKSINDYEGVATSLNNIGAIFNKQGDIPSAINYYHQSLKIYEEIENDAGQAQTLNNLGNIHQSQKDNQLALEYFHKSLKMYEKLEHKRGVSTLLNNIGFVYFKLKNNEKAMSYYRKSINIRRELNDKAGIASCLNNIASAYENENNIDSSMYYYQKCIDIYAEINNKNGLAIIHNNLARNYAEIGQIKKAEQYALKSLKIAQDIKNPSNIKTVAGTLSDIYERQGKNNEALKMYKLHIEMRDSILNEETQVAAAKSQARYEYQKNKAIDDAEHEKVIAIKNKEKEKQTIISIASGIGLVLVIIFLLFVFNRLKITRKQKLVIENQKSEIVDSITYAKRIQEAILPTQKFIEENLPSSFLLYKPKDIVAGDFYWVAKVDDEVFFAAADCTGHGVPGAMVSVVCHNALDRVLREFKLTEPGEILDKTRELVEKQLNKAENSSASIKNIRDGMDIALCSLNKKTNKLKYAGAYNPLWIIKSNSNEVEEIKATRQPIGRVENPTNFSTHSIALSKGDKVYIFSDGFADQFGGKDRKKMMKKRFRELLLNTKNLEMKEQSNAINNYFETWKGEMEQIDDVCIIGVNVC